MLIRSNAPVFGANVSPYQQPGDWQVSLSSRNLVSNDHYNGTAEQHERQERQNYITNRQNLVDLGVTRVFARRVSVSLGVPFVYSAWAFRDPSAPLPASRVEDAQWGRGIGDISVTARSWIFNPDTHPDWNVAAGGGIKLPTGNSRHQDTFLDVRGAVAGILGNPVPNFVRREALQYVDQSVQPGDGGWGLMLDAHGFRRLGRAFLFASGSYLANPRDTNDTPAIGAILGINTTVNSVPDQYMARVGGTVPVWKGFAGSLAWRMEGVRRYDLFGKSNGFRRPGTSMFVEPGLSYANGPHTVSFNVPIGYYYNRHPNPYTGNPGDATFPRHIFLTSYSIRLGRSTPAPPPFAQPASVPEPAPAAAPGAPHPGAERAAPEEADRALLEQRRPECAPAALSLP